MESGFYHGIVVVDYSNNEQAQEFEDTIGLNLQNLCKMEVSWRFKHARVDPRQVIRNDLDALGLLPN